MVSTVAGLPRESPCEDRCLLSPEEMREALAGLQTKHRAVVGGEDRVRLTPDGADWALGIWFTLRPDQRIAVYLICHGADALAAEDLEL